jgi:hypothetical protein
MHIESDSPLRMAPFAHVAGIPVEETAAALAPVAVVGLGALGASLSSSWVDVRRALRRAGRRRGRSRR